MDTEQLSQFPMGIITDDDVADHNNSLVNPLVISEDTKSYLQITGAVIIGSVLMCVSFLAYLSYDCHRTFRGKLSYMESVKYATLSWVSPERIDYKKLP